MWLSPVYLSRLLDATVATFHYLLMGLRSQFCSNRVRCPLPHNSIQNGVKHAIYLIRPPEIPEG